MTKKRGEGGLVKAGDLLTPNLLREIKGPSVIQKRLVDTVVAQAPHVPCQTRSLLYQHSFLCQTSLPYRDPGDDKREWERLNGDVHLLVKAGEAMHPETRRLVRFGLPFGPKSRLVLMYINQHAL